MKIIQIIDNFSLGGVNSFVYDLCYALKEQGCSVYLIGILNMGYDNNHEVETLIKGGIRVVCIGATNKLDALINNVGKLRNVIKEISDGEQTICNLHLKLSVLMGVIATRWMDNIKCVETYHNTYHYYHLQCWLCSPFIKNYICVSETAKEEMHQRFKIPYSRIKAIPNGVSRKRIRELAKIDQYKHEQGKLRIVSVGRLSYEKNFMVPIKAFTDICNKHITYTLVGDGPQEKEIREIASMNPYIKMTGALSRENSLRELAMADIVVMPSLWEGRSILQLEAMALDKPMIISDIPGLREPFKVNGLLKSELYRSSFFGYIVRTSDINSYIAAINDYVTSNNEFMDKIKYSLKTKAEEIDIKYTGWKYIQAYNEVINN
ncbi:MAG: glycosyltransferase [Phascolarctobacterium sp.]|nr:glycosyltransferase [Phascolarctobacterium sp.]